MTNDDTRKSLNRALRSVSDAQTRYHIRSALQRLELSTGEDQDEREVVAEE
jgi:hypothetical protein